MLDAIVVGAGIGGLAAAISLASAGKTVRVLEAAPELGGKAGIATFDGVEVDTGPTLLTMPEVFDELLGLAGMSLERDAPLHHAERFFQYIWPEGEALEVHAELERTLRSVAATLGTSAREELTAFLGYAGEIWEVARGRFIAGDAPSFRSLVWLGVSGIREASRLDAFSTMWTAIEKRVGSPHLRSLLARYATYNGSDPRRAPATLNCIAHVELARGATAVRGGTFELVRALYRAARRLGVEIEVGARVQGIALERGVVCGVDLEGGRRVRAGIVVANADVAHVARRLLPAMKRRILPEDPEPSMSGHCMIMRARRRSADRRAAHTVLFPADYRAEFVDIFERDRPPIEPTVYVCAQEKSHGRAGWEDHEPLFVMVNAPPEPEVGLRPSSLWQDLEIRTMARLVRAGLVEADDAVIWRRSPADLAARFPGTRGAIYGASSNSWNAAFKRPANVVSGVPGLFLASGSAHPGGGMPLAALSGMAAARGALRAFGGDRARVALRTEES